METVQSEGSTPVAGPLTEDWCAHHFDYLSHELGLHLNEVLAYMREHHPVAHSDQHGGYWIVTRYDDVARVAQDWETFSSAHGVSVPGNTTMVVPALPLHVDPPVHRTYRRLINAYFTPKAMAPYEPGTRELVTRLIDGFIEDGECDFMAAFARPFPGLAFFDLVLNAPSDEVVELNHIATSATVPNNPQSAEYWRTFISWIEEFVEDRRRQPPRGDVVDEVINAEIDGRPITREEILGTIQLLILGGLDTTAGALGQIMIRFCEEPQTAELLRRQPELIPNAAEELLRLEPPFIAIARTAMRDTEVGGQAIKQGEKVLIYWASANRDEAEFACPHQFDIDRASNRHVTFGLGPHRCAGSNLARLNLRVALEELLPRVRDVRLQDLEGPITFHSALNRAPDTVPITFTPGPRAAVSR